MLLKYTAMEADFKKSVKQIIEREFSLSSRALSKLKNSGGIKVNDRVVTVRHTLNQGDILTLTLDDKPSSSIEKSNIPLDILYEDEYILCINKPFGMPIHPSAGHHTDTLANAVMYRYRNISFTFRAITRLDGDTTGVVLIAKDALCAQRLTDELMSGNIKKEYAAIVEGVPKHTKFTIDAPIKRCDNSIIKRKVSPDGKAALTHIELDHTSTSGKYSLLKVFPKTGRTHQIRLHLSHAGFPIYGDFLYGKQQDNARTLLHCKALTFVHPINRNEICVCAPIPKDMITLIES